MDEELRERRNRQTDETNKRKLRMVPTDKNKLDEFVDGWTDGRAGEPEESQAKNQSAI